MKPSPQQLSTCATWVSVRVPICGDDDRLHGIVTDRDINVIKCLAVGKDAATTTAGERAQGSAHHVNGDADIQEMLNVMEEHQVRRLSVIENHRLVGILSEADIARNLPEHEIAPFVTAICSPKALTSH